VHAFAFSPPDALPVFIREHSFLAVLPTRPAIRLNPFEHEAFRFEEVTTALSLVRWKGNRRALILSERLEAVGDVHPANASQALHL